MIQSVDMRYNIRGQLTSINNSARNINADNNEETNDVFGMELLYDKPEGTGLGNTQYYTGMISAVKWSAAAPANTAERSYKYSYDKLFRLSASQYQEKNTLSGLWNRNVDGFNETLSYDENGNIKTLLRKSIISSTVTTIDNLTYNYKNTDNNNQLENISDAITNNTTGYGYRNFTGTASSTPYSYDDNGNLTGDLKKGTTITYNELNKPVLITMPGPGTSQVIEYRYDAAGVRISKYVTSGTVTSTLKQIEYIGGYTIEDGKLIYYSMAEGRVRNDGTAGALNLKMEYFITDQQGNVRVSFEDNGSGAAVLKQENSYYAFGMQMAGGYIPSTNPNKKLYNAGSEWQDDIEGLADYYSTFFREYDPVIGRFNGVDPMSESFESWTTYHYSYNNPVNFNDPLGDAAAYTTEDMIREMREEYRAWHDPQYGDNSSSYTVDRLMAMWGWGDWSDRGGGGGSYEGSYQQLKDNINDYGHEAWRNPLNQLGKVENGVRTFSNEKEALEWGAAYLDEFDAWGKDKFAKSYRKAKKTYKKYKEEIEENKEDVTEGWPHPTLTNWTNSTIWFEPEKGGEPKSLAPYTNTYIHIDGVTHPNYPGQIYKVKTGMDLLGVEVFPKGIIIGIREYKAYPIAQEVNEKFGGGWKSYPCCGGYFDKLFEKAGVKIKKP